MTYKHALIALALSTQACAPVPVAVECPKPELAPQSLAPDPSILSSPTPMLDAWRRLSGATGN